MNTQNNRENSMKQISRRTVLKGTAAAMAISAFAGPSLAQGIEELVIAYNVNLPSWDPTVGPSAVNPTIQGIYQSVFDQFILQQPDLSPAPGLLTEWGWNDDKTKIMMTVREGVTWHDGSPVHRRGCRLVADPRRRTRRPATRSSSSGRRSANIKADRRQRHHR
jgi:ABC-type transport system substrate-binding protein